MVELLPKWFTSLYGKKYGVFLPSGTLAIESALSLLKLENGSKVLIPSNACWKIGYAVRRAGLMPIFLDPGSNICIQAAMLQDLDLSDVSAYIAVHHLGLPVDIKKIKQILPGHIYLIEDYAQMWSEVKNDSICDMVVTSFGGSKPVALNYGGAVFFNNDELINMFDLSRSSQFLRHTGPVLFGLPSPSNEDLINAVEAANISVKQRNEFVGTIIKSMEGMSNMRVYEPVPNLKSAWARLPIIFDNQENMDYFVEVAEKVGILYQLPHIDQASKIPFIGGTEIISHTDINRKPYILLYPHKKNIELWGDFEIKHTRGVHEIF